MTNTIRTALACILFLALSAPAGYSRDIDVDAIYISKECPLYKTLREKKLGVYQDINSTMIDSGVIHATWSTGNEIVYVKESGPVNIIYTYDRKTHRKRELARLEGTVTSALITQSGRYLYMKQLTISYTGEPSSRRVILETATGKKVTAAAQYPFADYSIIPGGDSIVRCADSGVTVHDPDIGADKKVMDAAAYRSIINPNGVTIPYYSPNRKKLLIISGTGGDYGALVFWQGKKIPVNGITSASELFWLDNERIIYRAGSMGDFSARVLNVKTGEIRIIAQGSLNTNIRYSPVPKVVSLLIDQVLHVYDNGSGRLMNCGIEGEDASFSPDGIRFLTLLSGRLLMTSLDTLKDSGNVLKKNAGSMAALYQEAGKNRQFWNNEFTLDYIRKKISIYNKL